MKELIPNSTPMQNEEQSKLEERIIAYFDGSLDGEGSQSLLREVAENPETRVIFRGHETLQRLIAAAREPLEAPLEVKQSLSDRIPGLIAFLPGLFGAAETAPVITENANPFIAFFTRMSLTTAVSIGGAVALLTTGLFLKNNFESNSARTNIPKIAAAQNQMATAPKNFASGIANARAANISKATNNSHVASVRHILAEPTMIPSHASNNIAAEDNPPMASLTQPVPLKPVTAQAVGIPTYSAKTLTALTVQPSEGIAIKPYFSDDERILSVNGIGISAKDVSIATNGFLVGLDFDLGDRYVFHVQGGYNSFTTISSDSIGKFASVTEFKLISKPTGSAWTTVGLSYPIFNLGSVPLIVSGDVGAVWLNSTGFMARAGLSSEIPISSAFSIRPEVTYDEVMTSLPSLTGNLIFENPVANHTVWSSAVGINVGLVLHY